MVTRPGRTDGARLSDGNIADIKDRNLVTGLWVQMKTLPGPITPKEQVPKSQDPTKRLYEEAPETIQDIL